MTTLGICIPTYKRPEFLRRCVVSALEAAGELPIHIFIADDSMDETNTALYTELQTLSDSITVHRNLSNLGIDDNIQQCVDICNCDYAWIVGEDDYFLPGSVARVHALVQSSTYSFVFANYAYIGDQDQQRIGTALNTADGEMPGPDFIGQHLWAAGFIGACIVNRQHWGKTSTAPYAETYYTHVGRICELLAAPGAVARIVAEPCVANRVEGIDTFTWKSDSYGVFFGFVAMCQAVARQCPGVADEAHNAAAVMEQRYGWLTMRVAMRLRSEHGYDLTQYQRYLKPHVTQPLRRLTFYLISITPPLAFRPMVAVYRMLRARPLFHTKPPCTST